MSYTDIIDGITIITIPAHPTVKQLPTYGDWKRLLEAKGAQIAHILDGEVRINCLHCGEPHAQMDLSAITIGGLVRMPTEESTGRDEITRRTVRRPVSKTGLGCRACSALMDVEIRKVNTENAIIAQIARNSAEIAMLRGLKVKLPNPVTAFINVFPTEGEKVGME